MSKSPSPRADQLRAMREAQFARYEQMQKEAAKATAAVKPDAPEQPAARSTVNKAAKPAEAKQPKPAEVKAKKSRTKKTKKKSGR